MDATDSSALSAGELYFENFPDSPDYSWLRAHEDNDLPAEYRRQEDSGEDLAEMAR